jgi:hypothetical protein
MVERRATWRELITLEMEDVGEKWSDVVACTLSEAELDVPFYIYYGALEGNPFTLWTTNRVYFPVQYDGAEWVASVSRIVDGVPTEHIGG